MVNQMLRARRTWEKTTVMSIAQSSHQSTTLDATARDQKRMTTARIDITMPMTATATIDGPRSPLSKAGSTGPNEDIFWPSLCNTPELIGRKGSAKF